MTRIVAFAGIVALAASHFAPSAAVQRRPIDLEASDCSSTTHMFGGFEVARATRHASIPVGAGPLDIQPDANGGVRIERGGAAYEVTACIAAGAPARADAQAAADSVRLDVSGARVRVDAGNASSAQAWSVQLIVTAPQGASIGVQTSNGPIDVREFTGTLDLRAANGPISLGDAGGSVQAHAGNGPISVRGSRGEFDLETANGPIDVRIEGRRWDGHLTARASNGPLSVSVPADFESGVEVRSSNHAPWSCRAANCDGSRDSDEATRRLRLGRGPVLVNVSTVNGPVTVTNR